MKKSLVMTILFMGSFGMMLFAQPKSSTGDLEKTRATVARAIVEADSSNWLSILNYYTSDVQYSDPMVQIEGIGMVGAFLRRYFIISPDLVTTIENETCADGLYTATWTMTGTFLGGPHAVKGVTIIKFRGTEAKVYYHHKEYADEEIRAIVKDLADLFQCFREDFMSPADQAEALSKG